MDVVSRTSADQPVWGSPAPHWSTLSDKNEAAQELPEQPAAALLFQAPTFRQPTQEVEKREQKQPDKPDAAQGRGRGSSQQSSRDSQSSNQKSEKKTGKDNKQSSKGGGKKKKAREQGGKAQDGKSKGRQDSQSKPKKESGSKDQAKSTTRRRRRRPRTDDQQQGGRRGKSQRDGDDEVQALKGSTRLEAQRMRRREGRRDARRRQAISEAQFLARRESVDRKMVVRHEGGADQIGVLEDDILVEHFVARRTTQSIVGNVYLGKVQNVLPSMEAAFIDIGRGRNAVLYAGEVNWSALGMDGKPRRIELAMKPGDNILVQATKDPIGHKGARLTSQVTLAGRYLVFVPGSNMLGISRKLPESERKRLKKLLRDLVPSDVGVIVRTAAEGATAEQLEDDISRLARQWEQIEKKQKSARKAPVLLRGEPELAVRVVRDQFNEDVKELTVQGRETYETIKEYVDELSPELSDRVKHWTSKEDVFDAMKVRQQLAKAMDEKVWLPSGGSLIIERTEALTVIDVNTGKFVGSGGTLEETITRNNLEAAEEIVRQLRLRDIGGIIIIDFVDMVLEANRELVMRRLVEGLGRDRTRHQVTEITSLGLVQMTRKRVGEGLVEAFSTTCEICDGRGFIVHDHPVETHGVGSVRQRDGKAQQIEPGDQKTSRQRKNDTGRDSKKESHVGEEKVRTALSAIAAATVSSSDEEKAEATDSEKVTQKKGADKGSEKPTQEVPDASREPKEKRAAGVQSLDDIQLPEREKQPRRPARVGRRRAATTGTVDPSKASAGVVVRSARDTKKPDAEADSKKAAAAEAVKDLLGSE